MKQIFDSSHALSQGDGQNEKKWIHRKALMLSALSLGGVLIGASFFSGIGSQAPLSPLATLSLSQAHAAVNGGTGATSAALNALIQTAQNQAPLYTQARRIELKSIFSRVRDAADIVASQINTLLGNNTTSTADSFVGIIGGLLGGNTTSIGASGRALSTDTGAVNLATQFMNIVNSGATRLSTPAEKNNFYVDMAKTMTEVGNASDTIVGILDQAIAGAITGGSGGSVVAGTNTTGANNTTGTNGTASTSALGVPPVGCLYLVSNTSSGGFTPPPILYCDPPNIEPKNRYLADIRTGQPIPLKDYDIQGAFRQVWVRNNPNGFTEKRMGEYAAIDMCITSYLGLAQDSAFRCTWKADNATAEKILFLFTPSTTERTAAIHNPADAVTLNCGGGQSFRVNRYWRAHQNYYFCGSSMFGGNGGNATTGTSNGGSVSGIRVNNQTNTDGTTKSETTGLGVLGTTGTNNTVVTTTNNVGGGNVGGSASSTNNTNITSTQTGNLTGTGMLRSSTKDLSWSLSAIINRNVHSSIHQTYEQALAMYLRGNPWNDRTSDQFLQGYSCEKNPNLTYCTAEIQPDRFQEVYRNVTQKYFSETLCPASLVYYSTDTNLRGLFNGSSGSVVDSLGNTSVRCIWNGVDVTPSKEVLAQSEANRAAAEIAENQRYANEQAALPKYDRYENTVCETQSVCDRNLAPKLYNESLKCYYWDNSFSKIAPSGDEGLCMSINPMPNVQYFLSVKDKDYDRGGSCNSENSSLYGVCKKYRLKVNDDPSTPWTSTLSFSADFRNNSIKIPVLGTSNSCTVEQSYTSTNTTTTSNTGETWIALATFKTPGDQNYFYADLAGKAPGKYRYRINCGNGKIGYDGDEAVYKTPKYYTVR